jgi:hypothetical protein
VLVIAGLLLPCFVFADSPPSTSRGWRDVLREEYPFSPTGGDDTDLRMRFSSIFGDEEPVILPPLTVTADELPPGLDEAIAAARARPSPQKLGWRGGNLVEKGANIVTCPLFLLSPFSAPGRQRHRNGAAHGIRPRPARASAPLSVGGHSAGLVKNPPPIEPFRRSRIPLGNRFSPVPCSPSFGAGGLLRTPPLDPEEKRPAKHFSPVAGLRLCPRSSST